MTSVTRHVAIWPATGSLSIGRAHGAPTLQGRRVALRRQLSNLSVTDELRKFRRCPRGHPAPRTRTHRRHDPSPTRVLTRPAPSTPTCRTPQDSRGFAGDFEESERAG